MVERECRLVQRELEWWGGSVEVSGAVQLAGVNEEFKNAGLAKGIRESHTFD